MTSDSKENIDLAKIIQLFWQKKIHITVITLFVCFSTIFYTLTLQDYYKSTAILQINDDRESELRYAQQLSAFTNLAGLNIGPKSASKSIMAIEVLKSRDFISKFIADNDLLIELFAAKEWNSRLNKLEINQEVYDSENKQWVRKKTFPFKSMPSSQEAHAKFLNHMKVSRDPVSGLISISIEHISPSIAKKWVDLLVKSVNEKFRSDEIEAAENAIQFLTTELEKTQINELRIILSSLIQNKISALTLAKGDTEYLLKTIDSAIVPELKDRPQRRLIVALMTALGFLLSIFYILIVHVIKKE